MDSGSEIALPEVNKETFKLAAFLAHQTTFQTVETTTDNAYLLAIYIGRDLLIAVVFHIVGLLDGILELLKIFSSRAHRLKLLATTHIAVLQQFHLADDGVKFLPGLMDKDKVGHVGDKAYYTLPKLHEHILFERPKHTILHLRHRLQLFVGGIFGVRTAKSRNTYQWSSDVFSAPMNKKIGCLEGDENGR